MTIYTILMSIENYGFSWGFPMLEPHVPTTESTEQSAGQQLLERTKKPRQCSTPGDSANFRVSNSFDMF